ncbi:MAG: hypothetical protein CMI96_00690 [Pelagibacteraceae bacterium]|nr:hypothetical protein [Pelagibacteraceae bacterium]
MLIKSILINIIHRFYFFFSICFYLFKETHRVLFFYFLINSMFINRYYDKITGYLHMSYNK